MMSDLEKEEADSQSFVVLHRGEKEFPPVSMKT